MVEGAVGRKELAIPTLSVGVSMDRWFRTLAQATAETVGHSKAFFAAASVVVVWVCTGPLFHFSDTWQLVINTGTTIVTFLMVFLIQNTQNRDAHAVHLKLDELIRANKHARNALLGLEAMSDENLTQLQHEFERLRDKVIERRARIATVGSSTRASQAVTARHRSVTR
jgi:low affinity Fe/Cu permease